MSVAANMTLAHCTSAAAGASIAGASATSPRAGSSELRIATPSPSTLVAADLSGGNQQKVALAKWLVGKPPRVLILDHPLRGLDVVARRDILKIHPGTRL